jgi:GTP-binding protein
MRLPIVVIVGRPNVGKSSMLNCLAGKRISIVDPTAGVTRDRVTTLIEAKGRYFELVDTGGIGIEDPDQLTQEVERQIQIAIEQADLILFVVDIRTGVVPLDEDVNRRLRLVNKPVILVANKCDTEQLEARLVEFYSLGRGQPLPFSAEQKRHKNELLEAILAALPVSEDVAPPPRVEMKLAIVGRRNTGKSTFINALAQTERMIVSEVAGTTRDSVDVRFERDGKVFIAIDTAGVRRRRSISGDIEFYSLARAERSIRRADVVLLFFDSRLRVSKVDKQLSEYIIDQHKPAIFVVNKWDLAKDRLTTEQYADYMRAMFPMLDYVPIAFITAKKSKNVWRLLNLAQHLYKQANSRLSTGELNRLIQAAYEAQPPPLRQNRHGRIYYATQAAVNPPTIVLFTNGPELFDAAYQRFLIKYLRDHSPFREIPIRLQLRMKKRGESPPPREPQNPSPLEQSGPDLDLSRLTFHSELTEEEVERFRRRQDQGLWDI